MTLIVYVMFMILVCSQAKYIQTEEEKQTFDKLQKELNFQVTSNVNEHINGDFLENQMSESLKVWGKKVGNHYKEMTQPILHGLRENDEDSIQKVANELEYYLNCDTCSGLVSFIRKSPNDKVIANAIVGGMKSFCLDLFGEETCQMVGKYYHDALMKYMFEFLITEDFLCGYVFPMCGEQPKYVRLELDEFVHEVLQDKPQSASSGSFLDNLYDKINEEQKHGWNQAEIYNVLQITDWHVDMNYQEGSLKTCQDSLLCCQQKVGMASLTNDGARKYGEYNCDLPFDSARAQINWIVENLRQSNKPDVIIWSGDSISHDFYALEESDIVHTIKSLTELLRESFPDTPIIPTIGNHDFDPANIQSFRNGQQQRILEDIGELWAQFFTDQQSKLQFQKFGYFSMLAPEEIQSSQSNEKLRIISVNTQSCYFFNIALEEEPADAGNQIQWLRQELQRAEDNGEVVWLIGHVPPGYKDCIQQWTLRFNALIERYQHLIRFQTYGHVHTELFDLTRSLITDEPIGVEYIAGSLGTYGYVNPTVRLYQMHQKYHVPTDFVVYEYNIDQVNQQHIENPEANPEMYHFFDFRREFNLQSLSPISHEQLSIGILKNRHIAEKYLHFQWKESPQAPKGECDEHCRRLQHCETFTNIQAHKVVCSGESQPLRYNPEFWSSFTINPWVAENEQEELVQTKQETDL